MSKNAVLRYVLKWVYKSPMCYIVKPLQNSSSDFRYETWITVEIQEYQIICHHILQFPLKILCATKFTRVNGCKCSYSNYLRKLMFENFNNESKAQSSLHSRFNVFPGKSTIILVRVNFCVHMLSHVWHRAQINFLNLVNGAFDSLFLYLHIISPVLGGERIFFVKAQLKRLSA